jgi:hypothetical protein
LPRVILANDNFSFQNAPMEFQLEAGDEVYVDHGGHHNPKVAFGEQLRF